MFDNSPAGICGRTGVVLFFLLLAFWAWSLTLPAKIGPYPYDLTSYPALTVKNSKQLSGILKQENLWDIDSRVKPVIFANIPKDIGKLDIGSRKKIFLHTLLPAVLLAREEIDWEKRALKLVRRRLGPDWGNENFSEDNQAWQEKFSGSEIEFILSLARKYRTDSPEELDMRVDTLPVSLILAQGALESFWGTSRFAVEGNSMFGVWTWGTNGMVPQRRDDDQTHRVALYDSLLDCVRAYLLNLNRMDVYAPLWELRKNSDDPIILSHGLLHYSTRRQEYVEEVKSVINHNELKEYDSFDLDS